jgi:hypothetical protein
MAPQKPVQPLDGTPKASCTSVRTGLRLGRPLLTARWLGGRSVLRDLSGRVCRGGGDLHRRPLATLLTLLGVVEAVRIALTSAVVELVAAVSGRVVEPLAE